MRWIATVPIAFLLLSGVAHAATATPPGNVEMSSGAQQPVVSLGVCGSAVDATSGQTVGQACAPGFQPATTFINGAGVLTQVSPSNPMPVTGGGSSSGAASTVSQTSGTYFNDNLAQVGGTAYGLGRGTMASSMSFALASDQPAIPVTGFPTVQQVGNASGVNTSSNPFYGSDVITSLPNIVISSSALPTGAATSANQTTQIAAEQALVAGQITRAALSDTATSVPATTSTPVIAANATRKSLQVCGPLTSGASFEIGYGAAATPTSSIAYGPAGISLCNRWGPGDAIPTQALFVYSSVAATFHAEEGN